MLLLHGILLFYFVYGSHTGHNGHDLEFLGVEGLFHGQSLVDIHVTIWSSRTHMTRLVMPSASTRTAS